MSTEIEYLPAVAASILAQMGKTTSLVGIPGTTKTVFYNGLAHYLSEKTGQKWDFTWFVGSQTQSEELAGIFCPDKNNGVALQLPFAKLKGMENVERGLIFIDEANLTTRTVGAQLMTLVQDGRAGSLQLDKERIAFAMAINPEWASASARAFSAPEANRIVFVPWVTGPGADSDQDIYKEAGQAYKRMRQNYLKGGPGIFASLRLLPANWKDFRPQAFAMMAAFEDKFPEFTDERSLPDENKRDDGSTDKSVSKYATCQAWASSRSLETAAEIIAALLSTHYEGGLKYSLTGALANLMLTGAMGETASTAFRGWVKDLQFPPADEMLENATAQQIGMIVQALRVDFQRLCLDSLSIAATNANHPNHKARWMKQQEVLEAVYKVRQDIALSAVEILGRSRPRGCKLSDLWSDHFKSQEMLAPEQGA